MYVNYYGLHSESDYARAAIMLAHFNDLKSIQLLGKRHLHNIPVTVPCSFLPKHAKSTHVYSLMYAYV